MEVLGMLAILLLMILATLQLVAVIYYNYRENRLKQALRAVKELKEAREQKTYPQVSTSTIQSPKDKKEFKVQVTSYNPEVAQNDTSPCIAAGGHNICKLAKEGKKIIAVSRDLRKHFLERNVFLNLYLQQGNRKLIRK